MWSSFFYQCILSPQKDKKGLETLIAVVFCKECVLPVQWWFLFCKGGEDGRGTDGGGGRAKSRIARPKLIIKSCVNLHMNSNIHNEFPAPFQNFFFENFSNFSKVVQNYLKREKNSKNNFSFQKKNLKNFSKFFSVITEKYGKKKFRVFFTFQMILNNFQKIFKNFFLIF